MEHVSRASLAEERETGPALSSFEDFFRVEHVRLLRALFLITGNTQEAEDLMQDAFVKVWDRWDRVRAMDDPVGYLYRTAMNGFRSRARRAAVAGRKVLTAGRHEDPFAEIDKRDEAARVLAGLTRRQRLALVLTQYLGYSSDDAARLMGIKASTVRALTYQGRQALRGAANE